MIPHTVGWFPYSAAWIVYASEFLNSLSDLKKEDEDLYDTIPVWVPYAVFGTFVFFTLFTLPQWRYQYVSPDFYWKTEFWYCFLSLASKLFLGGLLILNVLRFSSFAEAMNDTPANNRLPSPSPPPPVG